MLLFQKRFHEGLVKGTVTTTFRSTPVGRAGVVAGYSPFWILVVQSTSAASWPPVGTVSVAASAVTMLRPAWPCCTRWSHAAWTLR